MLALTSLSAPAPLGRFVEDLRALHPSGERAERIDRLPDGRTILVFRVLDGRADVTVGGARRRALFKSATGLSRALIVRFKPGWAAAALGVPAHLFTDRFVPLEELWGPDGATLCASLLAADTLRESVDRIADAFAARAQPDFEPAAARLARRAVRLLEAEPLRVDHVANRLGVTARHLRRAFADTIGVGPKDFARGVRLQRAMHLAATTQDWGLVAARAGYCDQSHLIGDFRDLVGLTPSAFAKRATQAG